MGVPSIGCDCEVCTSKDPRDRRTRPSILLEYNGFAVLIDSGPDFREQAIRQGMKRLDAVIYTHAHADHILGLDDLRPLSFAHKRRGGTLPLYADEHTAAAIEGVFRYAFDPESTYATRPQVTMHRLPQSLELFGATFLSVPLTHGDSMVLGFRFGDAAYLTDFSDIPEPSMELLKGLDVLFLDALRRKPHPTHSTLENSVRLVELLQPKRAFFTHMSHDLKHEETNASLPEHIRLSHDGLKLEFEIA
jgi:phosphoribosyl 1,2-cyclic phosphate phosphodiesterase